VPVRRGVVGEERVAPLFGVGNIGEAVRVPRGVLGRFEQRLGERGVIAHAGPRPRPHDPEIFVPRVEVFRDLNAAASTIDRVLRDAEPLAHRGRAAAPVRGVFFDLYLIVDIWRRTIVGARVRTTESAEHAAALGRASCHAAGCDTTRLVLHADNGGPRKGATMVATLERLGVRPSFSRPGVSNDNPFSETLFRTLKYCPAFPTQPFADLAAAAAWVDAFVQWYNHDHQHSATRDWSPITTVRLNPEDDRTTNAQELAA
jgi:transposase InsO family protein